MLQVQFIKDNKEKVKAGLLIRNWQAEHLSIVDEVIALDDQRKSSQFKLDQQLSDANSLSKEIGNLFKSGKANEANVLKEKVTTLKSDIKEGQDKLSKIELALEEKLLTIPNVPHPSVKPGKSDEDNEVIQDWTQPFPSLGENALCHWEIAERYNLIDFKLGVKIAGAGFPVYRGKGAKLQRALINFFLEEAETAGYEEIQPPILVNEDTARATGQLPDKEGQMYHATADNFYLIPTAEVPVTNIVRNTILKEDDFPLKFTAYTPCFRREAGSYGKDVKGLNRLHQFDKIEVVQIEHPDRSFETLDKMVKHVENLLIKLGLPYRILRLCGGDIGFTSALTYDFEVYSAAQKRWLEVSSISNFKNFQSNRLKVRYKNEDGKMVLAHTLNGSALALPRIMAALLENFQTPDGVDIPEPLQKYTRFKSI